jgi:phage baseplate assembly protein W
MAYEKIKIDTTKNKNQGIGILLPFSTNNKFMQISYSTYDQAISNLKNLILTRKGERIFEPAFGTNIYDHLFDNIQNDIQTQIEEEILGAVEYWLPYINVNKLDVSVGGNTTNDEHSIIISMIVSIKDTTLSETPITFTITNSGITSN